MKTGRTPVHSGKMKRPDSSPPPRFSPLFFHSRHALSPYGFLRGQVHFKLAGTVKNEFTVGSMQKLAGKPAIVTGAGRGIGNAIARRFASEGARVILISRSPSSCGGAAEEINKEFPDSCKAYPCDVADYAAVQETMTAILKDFPQIDILVNNAGIAGQSLFQELTDERWHEFFSVNVDGAFYASRAVLPAMLYAHEGCIVNISSIWGQRGASCEVAYSATKAALIGLTRSLAAELAPSHIRVNCVAPGVIRTDMLDELPPELLPQLAEQTPMGRLGTPADIAAAVAFLASPEADFITGQVLTCDGGFIL